MPVMATMVLASYTCGPGAGTVVPRSASSTAVTRVSSRTKCAVSVLSASMVTVVAALTVDAASPTQWLNRQPVDGVAVTATVAPSSYVCAPTVGVVPPPAGSLTAMVRSSRCTNVAVTALSPSMVTVTAALVPVAAPVHASKRQPALAATVTLTTEPVSYRCAPGAGVVVPAAGSSTAVVRVYCRTNVAVTALSASMVRVTTAAVAVAAPVHSSKRQSGLGTPVRVTTVPMAYTPPAGLSVTVPAAVGVAAVLKV